MASRCVGWREDCRVCTRGGGQCCSTPAHTAVAPLALACPHVAPAFAYARFACAQLQHCVAAPHLPPPVRRAHACTLQPGYAATRVFDDMMHVINWRFLNRPVPPAASGTKQRAVTSTPAPASKPGAGSVGGSWAQELEPSPCATDTLTSWSVPTRKPPPPPPPEPVVEVNPYGRGRRRSITRRRRRSRSGRRGSQASRRSSIGSTASRASGRRTPASMRASTPVRHATGVVAGTAVAFDAYVAVLCTPPPLYQRDAHTTPCLCSVVATIQVLAGGSVRDGRPQRAASGGGRQRSGGAGGPGNGRQPVP